MDMLWSSLKQQGSSRWVRSAYFWLFFVPIAAHFLSSINEKGAFEIGDQHFVLTMNLPFSWKLFYFGAVSFSLAGFIYRLVCPALVRDYDSLSQFIDVGKGSHFLIDEFTAPKITHLILGHRIKHENDLRHFIKSFTTGVKFGSKDFRRYRDGSSDESEPIICIPDDRVGAPLELIPERLSEAFWFAREAADESGLYTRLFCTILYFIGYAAFFVVSCQGFWYVLWAR